MKIIYKLVLFILIACTTRLTEYTKTENAKQALHDKYFQTITNNNGESTTVYKLDINNPFLDKLSGIVYVDISKTYPTTCQAIVIDNLNIRDAPSLKGNIIGKIIKRTEITLYDKSIHQDEIDGENDFWYKVKLDTKNIYGWVYGAYVRIFFEDESLGYSDRELILESIE